MLLQLREVGLELTEEELWQWALDALLCPEDWKWLWESPAPAPIQSMFPTPPLPHLPWYDASSVDPPTTFALNVLSTSVPSVDWPRLDIPNEPVTCAPVPYVENSVAHAPPAMVFFFLFLFTPLFATFLPTVYVALCKPGCAISAADTSLV